MTKKVKEQIEALEKQLSEKETEIETLDTELKRYMLMYNSCAERNQELIVKNRELEVNFNDKYQNIMSILNESRN